MEIYGIESCNRRKNKKWIIIIILIAIIVIGMAALGGVKLAEHVAKQKEKEQNNDINIANNNQTSTEDKNNQQKTDNNNQNKPEQTNKPEIPSMVTVPNKNGNNLSEAQIKTIENIYDTEEKRAFLTFDDGPSTGVTPKILDILQQENVKATFFVLGTMVKSNPELLKREKEEGHYIANHGYSHVYKKVYANENKPLEEYNKTNQLIQQALGDENYQSNVFRFPGGSIGGYYDKTKTKAKKNLKQNGIASLDWNCLTNDADGADTKKAIMKNLKETCKGKNSIVVLMHDAPNKDLTAQTLPDVISYLKEQGYSFKSLYDIL